MTFTKQQYLLAGLGAAALLFVIILATRLPGARDIPKGPQVVHAVISAAPISLDRRGTHQLMTGSTLFAYAESNTVNLRPYEGQTVELMGTYELNIQAKDLPVLVVTSIKGNEVDWKNWSIPALGLELKTPKEWEVSKTASGADFALPSADHPVLSIHLVPLDEMRFKSGDARTVEGRRAYLYGDAGALQLGVDRGSTVDVSPSKRVMTFSFDTNALGGDVESMTIFERIMQSIRLGFASDTSSSTSRSTYGVTSIPSSGGLGEGSPCGGIAGVLCPAGFYCEITDREQNMGKCARL